MKKLLIAIIVVITLIGIVGKANAALDEDGHAFADELYGTKEDWENEQYAKYMKNYPKTGIIKGRAFTFCTNGGMGYRRLSFVQYFTLDEELSRKIRSAMVEGKKWRSLDRDYWCVMNILYGIVGYNGKVEYYLFMADIYGPTDKTNYTEVEVIPGEGVYVYSRNMNYVIIPLTNIENEDVREGIIGEGLVAPNVGKYKIGQETGKKIIISDFAPNFQVSGKAYNVNPALQLPKEDWPVKEGNWPYEQKETEEMIPNSEGKIYPTSPTRSWDYLRNFGKEFVPKLEEMQSMVYQCYPRGLEHYEYEGEPWYFYREMNYVIRMTSEGLYYVDLVGIWRQGENFGYGEPHEITLKYKDSLLWGMIGGYYQLYAEVARGQVMTFAAGKGRSYLGQLGGLTREGNIESGFVPYKVNKTDKIIAYGPFQPTNDGLDPVPPVEGITPETPGGYDPDWQPGSGGLPEWLKELFVPQDLETLPIVTSGISVIQPAVDLVETLGGMSKFQILNGIPEGKIMLWGGDLADTVNRFFGTEVAVPLIGKNFSLYGMSRIISGLSITVWMGKEVIKAAMGLFQEEEK